MTVLVDGSALECCEEPGGSQALRVGALLTPLTRFPQMLGETCRVPRIPGEAMPIPRSPGETSEWGWEGVSFPHIGYVPQRGDIVNS